MSKEEWKAIGLFVMLDLGIAFFVDDRIATGLVGVAAFVILLRNSNKLPKLPATGVGNAQGVL